MHRLPVPRVRHRTVYALRGPRQDNERGRGGSRKATRRRGTAAAVQRATPPSPEAAGKTLRQTGVTATNPEEKMQETEDGEGDAGDLTGYVLMGEDRWNQEVYGDWVHYNNGAYLSWG